MNAVDLMIFNNNTNSPRPTFSGSATNVPSRFLKSVCAQNFPYSIFYQHLSISKMPRIKYAQIIFLKLLNIFALISQLRENIFHHSQSHNPSFSQLRLLSSIQLLFKQYSFHLACFYLGKNSFIIPACTWIVIVLSIQLLINKDFSNMKQHKRYEKNRPIQGTYCFHGFVLLSWLCFVKKHLPPPKVHKYNLRMRPHNLTLPPKDDRNFIARQLYKNIYQPLVLNIRL